MASTDSTPIGVTAAADISTKVHLFGKMTATGLNVCTVLGERADGVIASKGGKGLGQGAALFRDRVFKVEAGGVFAAGAELTTDAAGKAVVAGAGHVINAIALEAGAAGRRVSVIPPYSRDSAIGNVDNAQVTPGSPIVYVFEIPDAATADYDKVLTDKSEVYDVTVIKSIAGAGNTAQVKNLATAITDAIAAAVDKAVTRAGTIDRAQSVVLAGGTLRITFTRAAGSGLCRVFVLAIKRA